MGALLYFEETQNATANVNFLISTRRLTSITKNNKVQDLHYILHFVKVKQQTQSIEMYICANVVNSATTFHIITNLEFTLGENYHLIWVV